MDPWLAIWFVDYIDISDIDSNFVIMNIMDSLLWALSLLLSRK